VLQAIGNPEITDRMVSVMKTRYLEAGAVVCNAGDLGDCMYFVLSGTLSVHMEDGTKVAVLRCVGRIYIGSADNDYSSEQ
jgi:CRP-like cAMP-binding protein